MIDPQAPSKQDNGDLIHMSPATAATFDPQLLKLLNQSLRQWTGQPVEFVSRRDLGESPASLRPAMQDLSGLAYDDTNARLQLNQVFEAATRNEFGAARHPEPGLIDIVTVPETLTGLEKTMPSEISHMPDGVLTNIPGTSRDWAMITFAHEMAGHLTKVDPIE